MIVRFTVVAGVTLLGSGTLSCHIDVDPTASPLAAADLAARRQPTPGSTALVCSGEAGSRLQDALIWSLGTGLLLTAARIVTFSEVKPKDVPYMPRAGCEWYEGRLSGCEGLSPVPHQPFNTYSRVMFTIGGTFSALLAGMLGAVVLRMLFRQSSRAVAVKLAVPLGLTYPCAIYLLLQPGPIRWSAGWKALLGSVVLFGLALILHRIDLQKSKRAGQRTRPAEVEREPAGPSRAPRARH